MWRPAFGTFTISLVSLRINASFEMMAMSPGRPELTGIKAKEPFPIQTTICCPTLRAQTAKMIRMMIPMQPSIKNKHSATRSQLEIPMDSKEQGAQEE
jgi:hypothetical protein